MLSSSRFNVDCDSAASLYSVNDKIGETDSASLPQGQQADQRPQPPPRQRPQGPRDGPGGRKTMPAVATQDIDVVQYDAIIPDYDDGDSDVPLLLGDPGRKLFDAE